MNTIDISIILPAYNAANYLDRCIVSLLRQTAKNIEIIIVDDGSSDTTYAIATSYAERFPNRIITLTQENQGPSVARNKALDIARGTYIGFMDSDDWADTDMYLKMMYTAEREQSDLVICGRYDVLTDCSPYRTIRRTPNTRFPCSSIFEAPELLSETTQFVWDKLFRRDIIEKHHIRFNTRFRFTEDVLFLCQYKFYCKCIITIPTPLYYHFQSDRDTTAKYGPSLLDVPEVLSEIFSFYSANNYFKQIPDTFFDLAAKRLLFRVDRFPYMSTKGLQFKFCKHMFQVMNQYFPDWRKRLIHYNTYGYSGGLPYLYRASYILMWLYIYLPNPIKRKWRKLSLARKSRKNNNLQQKSNLLKRYSKYGELLLNAYYRFFLDHGRLNDNRVLIQSKGGKEPAGNMLTLLKESLNHKKSVWLSMKRENRSKWKALCRRYGINPHQVHYVRPGSYAFYRVLATSGYLMNDSSFPHRFTKRDGQVYLNSWHGVPLKAMGCDVPNRAYAIGDVQRNLLLSDYLIYPNPFMHQKMFSAYMLHQLYPGKIIQESYPRVSILTDEARRSELRKELQLENKRVCCYLPTWRGLMTNKQNRKQYADCLYFLRKLDHLMSDDTVLYVKLHPYAQDGFSMGNFQHIRVFPEDFETYDFLTVCDVLITDYSSVFFDFAFSRRKIILFAYDYEEYKQDRGLYLDIEALPFPLVQTVEELYREICKPKNYDDTAFMEEFCPYDPQGIAERICRMLYQKEDCCQLLQSESSPIYLAYGELLSPGVPTTQLMQFLSQKNEWIDPEANQSVHFVTGILSAAMRNQSDRIENLMLLSPFLSVEPDLFYTPLEALAYILIIKKNKNIRFLLPYMRRVFEREYVRNFGSLNFAAVVFFSDADERHRLILSSRNQCEFYSYQDGTKQIEESVKMKQKG